MAPERNTLARAADSPPTGHSAAELLGDLGHARFRALVEALPHMVWMTVPAQGVVYFSSRWQAFTGRSVDELLGTGYTDLIHPDDLPKVEAARADLSLVERNIIFRLRRHDGEYRWMEGFGSIIHTDDGEVAGIVGGTRDVTERLREQQEAHDRSMQLESALTIANLGCYAYEIREQHLTADDRLREIFGVPGDSHPELFSERVHPDDLERFTQAIEDANESGTYEVEYRIRRPSPAGGTEIAWIAARGLVEFDGEGPVRMSGVVEDISVRRRAEEERSVAQRREALSALVGGIAHDFNNIIGVIASNARVAEIEVERGVDPRESLRDIRRGSDLAAQLVRRMLDYSRDNRSERQLLNLASVVEQAVSLVRPALPRDVIVRCTWPDMPAHVSGDDTQLHQVVVNLLANAGQALEHTGGAIDVAVLAPSEDEVQLVVRDDGPGMEDAVARRAFEPFFTTKPPGSGTGLGLSAVRSIVRDHGGTIAIDTAPQHGAAFTVSLPVAPDSSSARTARAAAAEQREPHADEIRVLVVDDEVALTRLAERALPLHGCTARTYSDPLQAAVAFAAHADEFDVVVTDQSMPGLTGIELAGRLRAARPDIPIILTSGFLTDADHAAAARQGIDAILPKPCTLDELVGTIRRLLDVG